MAETGVQSGCPFHDVTGLNCPGCGMTRAAHAALRGHLAEAFRFNPVGMILVPWVVLGLGTEGLAWVVGKPAPFRLWPGLTGTWCLTALLAVFWILRNLPWYPFTLLSPPV